MPFRATFDCLWCGASHACRGSDDLEGWAQLCPSCIGKAGDNGFLRFRLRQALTERGAAAQGEPTAAPSVTSAAADAEALPGTAAAAAAIPPTPAADVDAEALPGTAAAAAAIPPTPAADVDAELLAYYEARAPEYDDWYLRRGRYAHGPIHDAAWNAELDAAGRWLDALPLAGEIVELAAGTGWWSPLLASKGELSVYDGAPAPLDRARERLLAHRLRAHIHQRDAWAAPDRAVDALFTGFWLSHVRRDRLAAFLGLARRWLRPGGTYAFIDSRRDPQSSAIDHPMPTGDLSVRRLADGQEFTVVKVYYEPDELEAALQEAGFSAATVTTSGRFFTLGSATA